jgi:hypothetical protein
MNNRIPMAASGKPAFMHVREDQFRIRARYAAAIDQERMSAPIAQSTVHRKPTRPKVLWGRAKVDTSQNRAKEDTQKKNTATSASFPLRVGLVIEYLSFIVRAIK